MPAHTRARIETEGDGWNSFLVLTAIPECNQVSTYISIGPSGSGSPVRVAAVSSREARC